MPSQSRAVQCRSGLRTMHGAESHWHPNFSSSAAKCSGQSGPVRMTGERCNSSRGCSCSPITGRSGHPTRASRDLDS